MNKTTRYPPEVRERAMRMVFEHQVEYDSQWAAISPIDKYQWSDVKRLPTRRIGVPWLNSSFFE